MKKELTKAIIDTTIAISPKIVVTLVISNNKGRFGVDKLSYSFIVDSFH
jgi:hypothetical protein